MSMYWPIALIVFSNIFYNICSKQTPETINPFASLTVTYIVGAVVSAIMYYSLNKNGSLLREYHQLNWTAFVLGIAVVGLEAGSIYMYKAGWNINTGHLVHSSLLVIALIVVGYFLYHEPISRAKTAGIVFCLIGLYFVNKK